MIESILKGIMTLIINLVNLLLTPIDLAIQSALPSLSDGLNMVSSFFQWVTNLIPWATSWLGLNSTVISLVVAYYVFMLSVPIVIATIKLAIRWYNNLKP